MENAKKVLITDIENVVEMLLRNKVITDATAEAILHAEENGDDIICNGYCEPSTFMEMLVFESENLLLKEEDEDDWYLVEKC